MRDLGERFRAGTIWTYIQGWVVTAVSFMGGVAMARLLEAADFGVFAAVSAYTAVLARQLQLGIPESLLRTSPDGEVALDSGFWIMQLLAVACFAVAWLVAPALAEAYDDGRFVAMMRLVAALFLVEPLAYAGIAHMRRRMRHDRAARVAIVASLIDVPSGVAAAAFGAGPFAFVVGGEASGISMSAFALRASRWRPRMREHTSAGLYSKPSLRTVYAWETSWRGGPEMDAATKLARQRLSVLELVEILGNVSEACRRRGISRSQFNEYKRRFQTMG